MPFVYVDQPPQKSLDRLPANLWGFIWFFISQVKWVVVTVFVLYGLAAACQATVPFLLKEIVDTVTPSESLNQAEADRFIWLLGLLVLFGYVLHRLLWSMANYINGPHLRHYLKGMIHMQLFSYIVRHPISFFENDFAGRISSKIEKAGLALVDALDLMSYVIVASLITLLMVTVLVSQLNNQILGVFLTWGLAYGLLCFYFIRKIPALSANMADAISGYAGALVDTVGNISTVVLAAREREEAARLSEFAKFSAKKSSAFANFWFQYRLAMAALNAALAMTLGWLLYKGFTDGALTGGDVVMAITALGLATSAVWDMAIYAGDITRHLGIVRDGMQTLVCQEHRHQDGAESAKKLADRAPDIIFDGVTFAYQNNVQVLQNFSASIPAKAKIGLVGESGAGKTTLLKLLMHLYDPQQGEIRVNGIPLTEADLTSLRQHISFVSQDPVLFHRSLEENIRYGRPEATQKDIIAAAKKARAHDFIIHTQDDQGRKGYKAHVGERGVKLSGGQKQRVALARVFLEDAPILILDEATSALDSAMESDLQVALHELMRDKTVIAIAHRLSTLKIMDNIFVLEGGHLAEKGTHTELLEKNGLYAHWWKIQKTGLSDKT